MSTMFMFCVDVSVYTHFSAKKKKKAGKGSKNREVIERYREREWEEEM